MTNSWIIASIVTAIATTVTSVATPNPPQKQSSVLTEVMQCQSIADATRRLACYDQGMHELQTASQKREIVVVDKAQIRQTRKTLFGLTLPSLGILENSADGPDDEIKQIDTTLVRANSDTRGWVFVLADGARWRQTDDNVLGKRPRFGDKVIVRRGALGSFKLSLAGQPALKVRREN